MESILGLPYLGQYHMDVVQGRLPQVHPMMPDLGKPEWHDDLAIEAWWTSAVAKQL